MGLPGEGSLFEDKVASAVHGIVEVASALRSSLAAIEHNTGEIFWWTSWALGVVLGFFVLILLARVREQLVRLNAHQASFERMWAEDRENDDRIRREEKRERYRREAERASRAMKRPEGTEDEVEAETAARAETRYQAHTSDVVGGVRPVPRQGTREYQEYLRALLDN